MILASSSPISWLLALAAAVAYAVPAAAASRLGATAARNALLVAWVLHGAVLVWGLWGDTPRFGFAPALSMTAWLVLTVYAVERQLFPQMQSRWVLAGLGAAAIVLAMVFPGQPLHVAESAWLPLHLALGIACYGLFAAAVVHAWLMTRAERHIRQAEDPHSGIPLLTLERLTFRFVTAGFVLLTATLLAGWLFGEALYGRSWRWDHKAIFSLLSWLTFATLLLGRARFGWRGRNAVRVLYAGSALLLLAYVGSRFVLEVVLGAQCMKYLVLFLVLAVAIGIWRSRRAPDDAVPKPSSPSPRALPQDMLACAHCGVHIPQAEAVMLGNQAYCSTEHRQLGPA